MTFKANILLVVFKKGFWPFSEVSLTFSLPQEIWLWRCWNQFWCLWYSSWIGSTVCIGAAPSLHTLREQCIKGTPGPAKTLHSSWQIDNLEKLTPDLKAGMRRLPIFTVSRGWKPLITPYYFFQRCVVPEVYVTVFEPWTWSFSKLRFQNQYSCKYLLLCCFHSFLENVGLTFTKTFICFY